MTHQYGNKNEIDRCSVMTESIIRASIFHQWDVNWIKAKNDNISLFSNAHPSFPNKKCERSEHKLSFSSTIFFYWKIFKIRWNFTKKGNFSATQCRILSEILPLLRLCERSELVDIAQLFHSFSQTRLLALDFGQAKPKLDWKTWKNTRQFCREKQGKNDHILGKNRHCVCMGRWM